MLAQCEFLMTILDQIVADKRREVEAAKAEVSLTEISCATKACMWIKRPFTASVCKPGIRIIAEIKRASPSKGDISPKLDAAATAIAYERAGASAISVLTEPYYFKGSIEDLRAAKRSTELPVLRKDFIIDEYQIYESAYIGADAILLIVRTLELSQLKDYMQLARSLGLDCLVEIYTKEDLAKAIETQAQLVGINNRDLQSFNTNIANALELTMALKGYQMPVAASGIESAEDIELNKAHGISSFLVGESIVRSGCIEKFIRTLKGVAK